MLKTHITNLISAAALFRAIRVLSVFTLVTSMKANYGITENVNVRKRVSSHDKILFLFLNLDREPRNSTPRGFAYF